MARKIILSIFLVAAIVGSVLPYQHGRIQVATAQAGCQRFNETGHTLCGRFLQYWQQHGGLSQQGYPVSEPFSEASDTDSKIYTVQYFERAVFEMHPENPVPNDVLLSLLGSFGYRAKYLAGAPKQVPNTLPGSQLFPQTGKRLGGAFLTYWQSHGGLAQQGYPISDEFLETSATDGKVYKVQYFERAVFEAHPEKQAPYDVLLSLLGTFRLRAKYGAGSSLPSAPGFSSGGIGLTQAEWERMHGKPGPSVECCGIQYEGGKYGVGYLSNGSEELVAIIGVTFASPVGVDQARIDSRKLLPMDSQSVKLNELERIGTSISEVYDTYASSSLDTLIPLGTRPLFPESNGPDIWNGAHPGTITIKYDPSSADETKTTYMLLYIGGRNR